MQSCAAPYAQRSKVKIKKERIRCWEDKKRAPLPGDIKDKACNVIIQWTGTWATKTQQGLCLKATDIELMEQTCEYPFGQ